MYKITKLFKKSKNTNRIVLDNITYKELTVVDNKNVDFNNDITPYKELTVVDNKNVDFNNDIVIKCEEETSKVYNETVIKKINKQNYFNNINCFLNIFLVFILFTIIIAFFILKKN